MEAVKVTDGIYWVGAIDWNIRNFHGYSTPRGTSYNAYLITGDKNILIDTVKKPFLSEMMSRIRSIIDPAKIDLIVSNHVEMDHSSNLLEMQKATGATVLASRLGVEGLKLHYPELRTRMVADGEVIECGGKTLKFLDTPMLHWPDSMFTYVEEDKVLFSMDGFGQHYANSHRFNDEVDQDILFQEAAKYYANIILPFGARVLKTIEKVKDLDIRILATAHGAIWRTDLDKIIKRYLDWGNGVTREKAVVVYDTMWGSTEIMAKELTDSIAEEGVEVQLWRLSDTDRSHVLMEILDARAVLLGTPTLNNTIFPTVADMAYYMKGLRPTKRIGLAFGSHGWSGGGATAVHELMKSGGMEMPFEPLQMRYIPSDEDRKKCRDLGKQIAQRIKGTSN